MFSYESDNFLTLPTHRKDIIFFSFKSDDSASKGKQVEPEVIFRK